MRELNFLNILSEVEVDISDIGYVVVRPKEWTVENDGIGSYEYHGAVSFDHGSDYYDVNELELLSVNGSEDHKLLQRLEEKVCQHIFDNYTIVVDDPPQT